MQRRHDERLEEEVSSGLQGKEHVVCCGCDRPWFCRAHVCVTISFPRIGFFFANTI